jgi:O-acetyl-ADP-ribose deacetylase (regulator of RNase III)
VNLRIVVADATAVTGVPALVVPANKQLTLGWGSHVAEKVRKLAGPEVEREALARHPRGLALGGAVLTSAGRMKNFTHLIHAAVLDKYDLNPLFLLRLRERTSESTLRAATRNSLELARKEGLAGLVFTPMGAGIGGMKDDKCARIMTETIRAAAPAIDVVIACLREKTACAFRARIQ